MGWEMGLGASGSVTSIGWGRWSRDGICAQCVGTGSDLTIYCRHVHAFTSEFVEAQSSIVDMYAPQLSTTAYKRFIIHSYIFSIPTLSSLSNRWFTPRNRSYTTSVPHPTITPTTSSA